MTWVWWLSLAAALMVALLAGEWVRRLRHHGHSPAEIGRASLGLLVALALLALVVGGAVMMVSDFVGVMFSSGQRAVRNLYSPERPLVAPAGFLAAGTILLIASYAAFAVSLTEGRMKDGYLKAGAAMFGILGCMVGIIMVYVSIHLAVVAMLP